MIRIFILTAGISMVYANVSAQVPSKNKPGNPTTPANQSAVQPLLNPRAVDLSDTVNENRLVALAMKGPQYDASLHQIKINEYDLRRAKTSWLNLLTISTTYNDQTFAKPVTGTTGQPTYVYPKYYFGVTIPLGIIFSQGTQVNIAREAIANTKDQQEILSRTIKAEVLSKYKEYKHVATLIQMEGELINDVQAVATQAEENFKNGTITVDAYIGAQRAKNEELIKILNLQLQEDQIRIDLERIIGIPLESALVKTNTSPTNR